MVMPVGYYREAKLTGKKRVRKGWLGKLILQVEVELEYVKPLMQLPTEYMPPFCYEDGRKTQWRDAKALDVGLDTKELMSGSHAFQTD